MEQQNEEEAYKITWKMISSHQISSLQKNIPLSEHVLIHQAPQVATNLPWSSDLASHGHWMLEYSLTFFPFSFFHTYRDQQTKQKLLSTQKLLLSTQKPFLSFITFTLEVSYLNLKKGKKKKESSSLPWQ